MRLSSLGKRVESLERRLGGNQERADPGRFWTAMIGGEAELYKRITELWPFAEALQRLWRAQTLGGQEAVDAVWNELSETQRLLVEADIALHEHIMRRLKGFNLSEFDPSVWPEEVKKLVFEEVEE